ncbi:c-type cytochrome [Leptolyngbya sp. BC1307]|uniref:c-type cytochrome n=1 Tax=Leptolyngbya sp. BC1307 TaxID=2029589 RepID=UPI001F0A4DF2|nr:c-type cytochrome [Leptolyngbya sp. BC1307]
MRGWRVFDLLFSHAIVGLMVGLLWVAQIDQVAAQALAGQSAPVSLTETTQPTSAPAAPPGEALFSLNCAGCHAHGGNIIRRGKNLKQKTLVRRGYAEIGAIAHLITQGKGAMPAYADRLTAEEIEAIATYVLQQAEAGW